MEPIDFKPSHFVYYSEEVAQSSSYAVAHLLKKEFIFEAAPFPACHASTLIELEPGTFMAAWFGGTKEKAPDVGIWMSIYENGRWSEPVEVIQQDGIPYWNPVLFKMPSGEILLFYKHGPNPREWKGYVARSHDNGLTWIQDNQPQLLSSGEEALGPIKNKPILLEDGTLVAASSIESVTPNVSFSLRSTDGGNTWERSPMIGPLVLEDKVYGVIQPSLLKGKDKLMMLGRPRDDLQSVWYAESFDEGRSWSAPEKLDVPAPGSGLDAVTLKDGRHLLVYNHTTSGRKRLDVAISEDGRNWSHLLKLDEYVPSPAELKKKHIEFSYPAVIQAEDGTVHITYTWNRERIVHAVLDLSH